MDIVDALLKHHKEIRELLPKGLEKGRFSLLRKYLEVHHRNEELYFLKPILEKEEVAEQAAEAAEEHHVVNFMLADLGNFPRDHKRWPVKYGILAEFMDHHLDEEEEIFREIRPLLHKKVREDLGKEYETVTKRQLEAL
jgi:hypothetical protein